MARSTFHGKKRITVVLAALIMMLGIGFAYAYWTSTGTGDGTATTGTSEAFTIDTIDAVGTIAPGSAGQVVGFTVTNPSEGTLYLDEVVVEIATSDGTPWAPTGDCVFDDYTAAITDAPASGEIAAGASVTGEATVTLANTSVSQDDCQGQEVPLHFTAS